ncbi:MAG: YebC/PmpR family DNA-binding transcriptional regulator [Phycisphaerales bacterium]|nr:MAG: YebC/PmpR family DNA-binding transcriptional regulator [Phycisphaerales bacterium]
MSGHSKWSTIKHKKAALDAKRGKTWSKLARAVTMAAKAGGGNPNDNPTLRLAIEKAKGANMPKDTIEKAVKKGTGEIEGESYEDVLYEGYGPGGVAVMCRAVTDNRNRTSAEIKKVFERAGGNLGSANCVAFQFKQKGVIVIDKEKATEEQVMEIALEAGADDISSSELAHEVICPPETFEQVRDAFKSAEIEPQSDELSMVADNLIALDIDTARKVARLVDALEEHDDVDAVYSNSDISDDVVAQLMRD